MILRETRPKRIHSALLRTDLEKEGIARDNDDHIRHTIGQPGIDSHKLFDEQSLLVLMVGRGRKADDRR